MRCEKRPEGSVKRVPSEIARTCKHKVKKRKSDGKKFKSTKNKAGNWIWKAVDDTPPKKRKTKAKSTKLERCPNGSRRYNGKCTKIDKRMKEILKRSKKECGNNNLKYRNDCLSLDEIDSYKYEHDIGTKTLFGIDREKWDPYLNEPSYSSYDYIDIDSIDTNNRYRSSYVPSASASASRPRSDSASFARDRQSDATQKKKRDDQSQSRGDEGGEAFDMDGDAQDFVPLSRKLTEVKKQAKEAFGKIYALQGRLQQLEIDAKNPDLSKYYEDGTALQEMENADKFLKNARGRIEPTDESISKAEEALEPKDEKVYNDLCDIEIPEAIKEINTLCDEIEKHLTAAEKIVEQKRDAAASIVQDAANGSAPKNPRDPETQPPSSQPASQIASEKGEAPGPLPGPQPPPASDKREVSPEYLPPASPANPDDNPPPPQTDPPPPASDKREASPEEVVHPSPLPNPPPQTDPPPSASDKREASPEDAAPLPNPPPSESQRRKGAKNFLLDKLKSSMEQTNISKTDAPASPSKPATPTPPAPSAPTQPPQEQKDAALKAITDSITTFKNIQEAEKEQLVEKVQDLGPVIQEKEIKA